MLIKLIGAYQRSHYKVGHLASAHEKENAFIIFVYACVNVILIRIKATFKVQKHGRNHIGKKEPNYNMIKNDSRLIC